jgi:hypothetical protein
MHGSYHILVGIGKMLYGNKVGLMAEFRRAWCQFRFNGNLGHHKAV